MMMSSIDLFFSRDWAGGAGPAVDAPRFAFVAPGPSVVVVVAGCAGACETLDGAVDFARLSNRLEVGADADVDAAGLPVASELVAGVLSCVCPIFGNRLFEGAFDEGADVPELLGGLLKKLKAFDAAVDNDPVFVTGD